MPTPNFLELRTPFIFDTFNLRVTYISYDEGKEQYNYYYDIEDRTKENSLVSFRCVFILSRDLKLLSKRITNMNIDHTWDLFFELKDKKEKEAEIFLNKLFECYPGSLLCDGCIYGYALIQTRVCTSIYSEFIVPS